MSLFRRKKSRRQRLEQRAGTLLAQGRHQVAAIADDAGQVRDAASDRAAIVAQAVKATPGALAPGAAGRQVREAARHAADAALALWEQGDDRARATLRSGEALERAAEHRAIALARSAEERTAVITRAAEERATDLARGAGDAARARGKQARKRLDAAEHDAAVAARQAEALARQAAARAGEIADDSAEAGRNLGATFLWGAALGFVILVFWMGREERNRIVDRGKGVVGDARRSHGDASGRAPSV